MKPFTLAAFSDEAAADLQGQIRALKRNGIPHMELRNIDNIGCASLTVAQAKEIRKELEDNGLSVRTVGSPIGKVKITDDFSKEMDRFLRITELAEVFGAEKIRMFSFYRDDAVEEARGKETALIRIRAMQERAGKLVLCHENEKGIYGDSAEFCKVLCEETGVRAIFDPANFVQCGVDTLTAWSLLKQHTEYLHLKDANAKGIVVPCGDGIGNVPFIIEEYLAQGGDFATLEPHLGNFASKKLLEKEADETCGYRYDNLDEAFDAAVVAVDKILSDKGAKRK